MWFDRPFWQWVLLLSWCAALSAILFYAPRLQMAASTPYQVEELNSHRTFELTVEQSRELAAALDFRRNRTRECSTLRRWKVSSRRWPGFDLWVTDDCYSSFDGVFDRTGQADGLVMLMRRFDPGLPDDARGPLPAAPRRQ